MAKPHILYGKLSNSELRKLIKDTSSLRVKNSAGHDLIEMRQEYDRRRNVRVARIKNKTYNKKDMLERPADSPKFKPGNFVAGMSPKQEKFCMEYIATGDSLSAYKAAGYAPGKNHADTRRRSGMVMAKPKIKQRIEDLREVALDRMAWSADHVLNRLDEVYKHSLSNGDYTNANRSIEAVAKHLGMFVDRSEQKIKMGSFGSGEDDKEAVHKDIERLAEIAGLRIIEGGRKKEG